MNSFIVDFINIIRRNKLVIIIIVLLFLSFAFYLSFVKRKVYRVNFTITSSVSILPSSDDKSSNTVTSPFNQIILQGLINNFNLLYNNQNDYHTLELSKDKKKMDFKSIETIPSPDSKNSIDVVLFANEINTVKNTTSELIAYLNNNDLIKTFVDSENKRLNKLHKQFSNELEGMLQLKTAQEKSKSNSFFNVFEDIAKLQEKIANIEQAMNNISGFRIVTNPVICSRPEGFSTPVNFIFLLILGLVSGSFVAIILDKINNPNKGN